MSRPMITVLFLALLAIELTDVVFALDSIPAVLSITRNPFLAYTSNIMAVMGLRSLFFLLAHLLTKLRFLHYGLAARSGLRRSQDALRPLDRHRPSRLLGRHCHDPDHYDHAVARLQINSAFRLIATT